MSKINNTLESFTEEISNIDSIEKLNELKAELLSIHKSMISEGPVWEGLISDLED